MNALEILQKDIRTLSREYNYTNTSRISKIWVSKGLFESLVLQVPTLPVAESKLLSDALDSNFISIVTFTGSSTRYVDRIEWVDLNKDDVMDVVFD